MDEELKTSERSSVSTTNSTGTIANALSSNGPINKAQKMEIEQSATYIGYKLMW